MSAPPDVPGPLRDYLRARLAEPLDFERLGGMSVARVWRASGPVSSAIVKATPRPAEPCFYRDIAPVLQAAGVPTPDLYWQDELDGLHWLVIEDVPDPYPFPDPDGSAPADTAVLSVLARLHAATVGRDFVFPRLDFRGWKDTASEAALGWFEPAVAREMAAPLARLQAAAPKLEDAWCWISGDPSPPNWGRRDDGTPVLYDWELFRTGVPATDLAITVRGLPALDDFRQTAERYLVCCEALGCSVPWDADALACDMAAAKVGTVVVLLAAQAGGNANVPAGYIANLVATVPSWIVTLADEV